MRLSKRIAIGVMAAALALSMTACGGDVPEQPSNSGADGTNTSTGSNTSTDTGDKKDDTKITPPKDDSKEDDKKDEVQGETRTEKFFSGRNIINGARWTYTVERRGTVLESASNGTFVVASDSKRMTIKIVNNETGGSETISDVRNKEQYIIKPVQHSVSKSKINSSYSYIPGMLDWDGIYFSGDAIQQIRSLTSNCEIGTYKIDNVVYYSETYTMKTSSNEEARNIFCFDMNDKEGMYLRYYITITKRDGKEIQNEVNRITNIKNTFDDSLLQIPEGYDIEVYDEVQKKYISTGEKTSKDNYPN